MQGLVDGHTLEYHTAAQGKEIHEEQNAELAAVIAGLEDLSPQFPSSEKLLEAAETLRKDKAEMFQENEDLQNKLQIEVCKKTTSH